MSKIDDLKKELAELEAKEKEDQEIKDLQRKINAKKFGKTTTGKIFNKIADVGDKMTKPQVKDQKSPQKKKKPMSVEEIMKKLPQ